MEDINNWQTKFESCQYSEKLINKLVLLNKATKSPILMTVPAIGKRKAAGGPISIPAKGSVTSVKRDAQILQSVNLT